MSSPDPAVQAFASTGPAARGRGLIAVGLLCTAGMLFAQPLPTASEVTRRMIERSASVAGQTNAPRYVCEKRSRLEHRDSAGQTTHIEEKWYQVTWIAGFPFNRLVRVQGRTLTPAELDHEQRREEHFRERITSLNPRQMAARREGWVTATLLNRFDYYVKERVLLHGRPTLIVQFFPRPGGPFGSHLRDRLLGALAGTLWVDEQDMEVSLLQVHLCGAISLGWLGLLGSLSQCDLEVERQRMPEGVWLNTRQRVHLQARRLATPIRFTLTEEYSDFVCLGAMATRP